MALPSQSEAAPARTGVTNLQRERKKKRAAVDGSIWNLPNIKFAGKTLFRKDFPGAWQAWVSFEENIVQVLTAPKWGVVVVLDGRKDPRNVFLVGFDGKIRWQIQPAPFNEGRSYHMGRLVDGEHPVLVCYRGAYGVEMESGSVEFIVESH